MAELCTLSGALDFPRDIRLMAVCWSRQSSMGKILNLPKLAPTQNHPSPRERMLNATKSLLVQVWPHKLGGGEAAVAWKSL